MAPARILVQLAVRVDAVLLRCPELNIALTTRITRDLQTLGPGHRQHTSSSALGAQQPHTVPSRQHAWCDCCNGSEP